jgi:hypothetical protein
MLQAIQKDPNFAKNTKQLVILGGAYYRSDDVKPAAEANVSLQRQKLHFRNVKGLRPTSHMLVCCWL